MRRRSVLLVLSLLCLISLVSRASAQEAINYGSIGGQIKDPQGSVILGAEVVAIHSETNVKASALSNLDGRFRFPFLKVGRYEIGVRTQGFKAYTRALTLNAGSAFELPIALEIDNQEVTVTVKGEASTLETARSQIAGTVSSTEVRALPMNGRSFLDLALLMPSVSPTNLASQVGTQGFAETTAVPGSGLSVNSQRNLSNSFIIDGVSANDDAAGLSGIPLGVESVEQFQVITSGGQAELGRALGGYVNVVTKSGANIPHGSVYQFFRDDALNAANPLLGRALPMHQNQYGFSFGGPIAQDRTFFFTNVEQRDLTQSGLTTILPANVEFINARLAATGYPGSQIVTGVYPNPLQSTVGLAKVDHQTGSQQMSLRYSLYRVTSDDSRGAGGLSAPSAGAGLNDIDHAAAFGDTWALSGQTFNETRVQFAYGDLKAPNADPIGPQVSISGVASFGRFSQPTERVNKLVEVVDTLSHQTGAHALRAGVDFLYNDTIITFPRAVQGAYTFSSLANFLSGTYNNGGFTQSFGNPAVGQTNPNLGLFVQDQWQVGSSLTLNAGLRYDLQFLQTIATDTNNVSPRLGFAWTPWGSHGTVVRGSTGLFYDRVPLRALANAIGSANNTTDLSRLQQISVSLSPAQAEAPGFPNVLSTSVATLVNLSTMDPQMHNARAQQDSIEIEHQIGASTTVSAGYQYLHGSDLIISINQNVPTCVAAGSNNGCRPITAYANNNQYSSAAHSTYHGLHVSLVQRPAPWGSYRVSYTLSNAKDDVGKDFSTGPIDPFDLSKDWGRSDNDQRHRLVVNGAVHTSLESGTTLWTHLTNGFQVSGTMQYYSALPLNITSGVTTIQGTAGRPIVAGAFIPRNAGVGPDFLSINLRLSRTVPIGRTRLEALVECFNLTNRENVLALNGNFGSGVYPTTRPPRSEP